MNVAAGTYTGNGDDNRRVRGLGFRPLAVFVKGEGQQMMIRFRTQLGDLSKTAANTVASQADCIQSIDYDGFTLGSNAKVNNDATTFYWLAIGETAGQSKAIRYTGNGTTQGITGIGFQPALVILYADTATPMTPLWKSNTCTNTITFSNSASTTAGITSLDADGFTLGSALDCNTNGVVYHALCLLEVAGAFQTLTYPGNSASASISTTGAGFRPTVVLIAKEDATTGRNSAGRWVGQSGDSSALVGGSSTTDLIESLDTDGFTVGQAVNVNEGTSNYHALVFKASAVLSSTLPTRGRRLSPILRGQVVGAEHVRELQDQFNRTRGHTHSGAADDAPRIATTTVTDLDAALFGDVVATRFTGGNSKGSSGLVADAQHIHNTPTHEHTGALSGGTLGTNAIATAMIQDQAITAAKILPGTITQIEMGTDSVSTNEIEAGAITSDEIGSLPRARVYNNADPTTIANDTETYLTFNTERYDTNVIHDTVTNPGRLTCKKAGVYRITASVQWDNNATGRRALLIRLNGTTIIAGDDRSAAASDATRLGPVQSASTTYPLAVNDYVELGVYQNSGGNLLVKYQNAYSPEFMMEFIGGTT